jgi:hypothetical protein
MSESPIRESQLPTRLQEIFSDPAEGEPWPESPAAADLADCELYVEEQLLGQSTSRFVKEGGVRLNRVTSYEVLPEELPAMFSRRSGLDRVRVVLVKFWLMFDELPPKREYAAIRIRISFQPAAQVLLLRPDTGTQSPRPGPAVTAVDQGAEGFGWTYQAQDGTPLTSRREITLAMLECARETTRLAGLLDAEAQIDRFLLGTAKRRPAAPKNSAVPFQVSLPAGD